MAINQSKPPNQGRDPQPTTTDRRNGFFLRLRAITSSIASLMPSTSKPFRRMIGAAGPTSDPELDVELTKADRRGSMVSVGVWALLLFALWLWMLAYHFSGDYQALDQSRQAWPNASPVGLVSDRSTLLLFLHPHCSCSHATVSEMHRMLEQLQPRDQPRLQVVVCYPPGKSESWTSTSLIKQALQLPRAEMINDERGQLASLFGARNSGNVMLFNTQGHRLFAGGITVGRGHEGASIALNQLKMHLQHVPVDNDSIQISPVFGCRLYEADPPER